MSLLFLSWLLLMSILVGCSSSNFFLSICMLELTMYTFLFMSYEYKLLSLVTSCIKYFFVQSIGSIFLFLGGVAMVMLYLTNLSMSSLFLVGFILKLGAFPLFFWVIPVNSTLSYLMVGILSSPMKILPLSIMVQYFSCYLANISNYTYTIFLSGIFSIITGMFLGLTSKTLRSMLGASSIAHTGWLFIAMPMSCTWHYFSFYSLGILSLFASLVLSSSILSSIGLLSLGGLPPFGVFTAKLWVVWQYMHSSMSMVFLVPILASSALSLFYYMKYSFHYYLIYSLNSTYPLICVILFTLNLFSGCFLLYMYFL